jgi:hypothetical protein
VQEVTWVVVKSSTKSTKMQKSALNSVSERTAVYIQSES